MAAFPHHGCLCAMFGGTRQALAGVAANRPRAGLQTHGRSGRAWPAHGTWRGFFARGSIRNLFHCRQPKIARFEGPSCGPISGARNGSGSWISLRMDAGVDFSRCETAAREKLTRDPRQALAARTSLYQNKSAECCVVTGSADRQPANVSRRRTVQHSLW